MTTSASPHLRRNRASEPPHLQLTQPRETDVTTTITTATLLDCTMSTSTPPLQSNERIPSPPVDPAARDRRALRSPRDQPASPPGSHMRGDQLDTTYYFYYTIILPYYFYYTRSPPSAASPPSVLLLLYYHTTTTILLLLYFTPPPSATSPPRASPRTRPPQTTAARARAPQRAPRPEGEGRGESCLRPTSWVGELELK